MSLHKCLKMNCLPGFQMAANIFRMKTVIDRFEIESAKMHESELSVKFLAGNIFFLDENK